MTTWKKKNLTFSYYQQSIIQLYKIWCYHNTILWKKGNWLPHYFLKCLWNEKKKCILPANIINMVTRELYFYNLEAIITVYTFKLAYYLHFTDEETYIHR